MYLVDWEYAGMNDPMWDLGDLSVEAGFGPEQDEALLRAYFEGAPPAGQRGRMVLAKGCDLVWTLWGLLRVMNDDRSTTLLRPGPPAGKETFASFGQEAFAGSAARCRMPPGGLIEPCGRRTPIGC